MNFGGQKQPIAKSEVHCKIIDNINGKYIVFTPKKWRRKRRKNRNRVTHFEVETERNRNSQPLSPAPPFEETVHAWDLAQIYRP